MKISVLVPIYNVEKYLEQCLESIRNQSLQDFEVLCINDGSTDGSKNIIEKYTQEDKRFILIDKINSGYGSSMNLGLKKCRGDYIAIVEADDYIETEMFAKLYKLAEDNNLCIARCSYYQLLNGRKLKVNLDYIPSNKVICPLEYPVIFYQPPAIWTNLYRRGLLENNRIQFLKTPGAAFQDTSFIFKAYAFCCRFMFIDEPLLNYRLDNPNSSVNNVDKAYAVCNEYYEILSFAKQHNDIYAKIKHHIPVIRYACYAWNYGRIDKQFRMGFLKKWALDIKRDYAEGRIDKSLFSSKKKKRMSIISRFPFVYKWRHRPL